MGKTIASCLHFDAVINWCNVQPILKYFEIIGDYPPVECNKFGKLDF